MTQPRSPLMQELTARGFVFQSTDPEGLDQKLQAERVTGYIGFDPTGDSLHVGHLVSIMQLRWLQRHGHKPIVLLGGGTAKIGDPSGKDEQRQFLSDEQIEINKAGIRRVFDKFLSFGDGPTDAILVDNAEWLDELRYIPFLRDIGRHFTVNRMLTFDSVKSRLEREQPLSFLEFNYMILQAYDFVELARRYGCVLQLGGSDQWGNIVNGMELGRRLDDRHLFGQTSPLITNADGAKMGKTAKGAVWLNEDRLSAYDYWQFWRNTQDADVGRFLRLFTDLPLDEIARLEALEGQEVNDAKRVLANAATTLAHGPDAARAAEETAQATFAAGGAGAALPTLELTPERLAGDGVGVLDLFVEAGLADSKKEVRRLIAQNGARVDGQPVGEDYRLTADALPGDGLKLSAGKKRHAVVRPAGA
ncbi:tyrosyl-tRNA synthetase [Rhodothalassium salexigens DSM 2132]|uniref:Tyrosine--tRNA ligase n=1 Tax=Rhodothalassium salexigens DSM 2132 TaxID=1188247 RepID=A0A4R2PTQ6_RHOSA|nr:tyrosine--tRNA ligase [Rhodothalassium salexigens]MBB4210244.1 tyrosyl-tRNA synthetase [Rhodothalassium salexigens DSM 2132]MBK1640211.1 tyrosine--tRNA ligase [Rhodothalassium salexigens DSM 2132]TCP38408.1 tyrosyl-tRNA synthetase [Rhodothalassium salexigens DSM 2132]